MARRPPPFPGPRLSPLVERPGGLAKAQATLHGQEARRRLLLAYVAMGIFFFMLLFGFRAFESLSSGDTGGGTPIGQLFYAAACLATIAAIGPFRRPQRLLVLPITWVLVLAWCWLSMSWAISPSVSMRRLILVTMIVWTLFALVQELGYKRSLDFFRIAVAAAMVASYVAVFALPSMGFQPAGEGGNFGDTGGGWRGILIDKNACGAFAAVATFLFLFDAKGLSAKYRWPLVLASFVCLVFTTSKTSIALAIVVVPIAALIGRYNPKHRLLLVPAVVCAAAGVYAAHDFLIEPFREALYDPQAFTGRGQIWYSVTNYVADHPLLGSGFGSFWAIGADSPIFSYSPYPWVTKISQGHNGYIDLAASIGFPGLILALVAAFFVPLIKIMASHGLRRGQMALIAAIILFSLGNNLTESSLLNRETFLNVALIFAIAMLRQAVREATAKRQAEIEAERNFTIRPLAQR